MADWVPVLLIAMGALPGVLALLATILLWRQRRILEVDQVQYWTRVAYLWLAVFCVAALIVTQKSEADTMLIAFGWIAAPALTSVIGLFVFADRQRMTLDEFPSPRRMRQLTTENRQELRYITAELSSDLNRALDTQGSLQRGGNLGRPAGREMEELERSMQRIRTALQRCHELDARYGLHVRRLKDLLDDPRYDEFPLDAEAEGAVEELQGAQHELDRQLDKLIESAVQARSALSRTTQAISWVA